MDLYQDPEIRKAVSNLAILSCKTSRSKPTVLEYVDLATGEIIDAHAVKKLGVRVIKPDARIRRRKKLDSLRRESREFAEFLLKFRDSHCKFLVPLETLIYFYSKLTGKETRNIKRYFPSLIIAGVLDSDLMLNEDFMINNPLAGSGVAKGDKFLAYNTFDRITLRRKARGN